MNDALDYSWNEGDGNDIYASPGSGVDDDDILATGSTPVSGYELNRLRIIEEAQTRQAIADKPPVELFFDTARQPRFMTELFEGEEESEEEAYSSSLSTTTSSNSSNNHNSRGMFAEQQNIVIPLRDEKSSMARAAKEGSQVMKDFRRHAGDRAANREAMDASKSTTAQVQHHHRVQLGQEALTEAEEEELRQESFAHHHHQQQQQGQEDIRRGRVTGDDGGDHRHRGMRASALQSGYRSVESASSSSSVQPTTAASAAQRRARRAILKARAALPIARVRQDLMQKVWDYPVVIVQGETGSGKTTQMVQYLLENGYAGFPSPSHADGDGEVQREGVDQMIACTQPRKVAAVSVARRVAEEVGCEVGTTVGYTIQLEDCTTPDTTRVRFMTEGILLREIMADGLLSRYSVIVMDEAHERSVNTDVLLGVLRTILPKRRDLHLIVTSATMDVERFSEFFGHAPIFKIPGKMYNVNVQYEDRPSRDVIRDTVMKIVDVHLRNKIRMPPSSASALISELDPEGRILRGGDGRHHDDDGGGRESDKDDEEQEEKESGEDEEESDHDYCEELEGATTTADEERGTGADILVFVSGKDEVEGIKYMVYENLNALNPIHRDSLLLLPLYSELPQGEQLRALAPAPAGKRKCVIATNVAETSLTIDGVRFVIDTGFMKTNVFRPAIGMNTLLMYPISQAEADQRKGRAGRTAEGTCYRMYTDEQYKHELLKAPVPEIQRSSIDSVVLMLKSIGINDLIKFRFLDRPPLTTIRDALFKLWMYGALDSDTGDITRRGYDMAELPMDPSLARVMLAGTEFDVRDEVLTIVSIISVDARALFLPPGRNREEEAQRVWGLFRDADGDHLTLLNIFNQYVANARSQHWCQQHYLKQTVLKRADDIREYFSGRLDAVVMRRQHRRGLAQKSHSSHGQQKPASLLQVTSSSSSSSSSSLSSSSSTSAPAKDRVRRALASGYVTNVGRRLTWNEYESVVKRAPSVLTPHCSLLVSIPTPEYIVYHEFLQTTKAYISTVSAVEPEWIVQVTRGVIRPVGETVEEILQQLGPLEEEGEEEDGKQEAPPELNEEGGETDQYERRGDNTTSSDSSNRGASGFKPGGAASSLMSKLTTGMAANATAAPAQRQTAPATNGVRSATPSIAPSTSTNATASAARDPSSSVASTNASSTNSVQSAGAARPRSNSSMIVSRQPAKKNRREV